MHGSKENGLYFCTDNSGCSRALFGAVGFKWDIMGRQQIVHWEEYMEVIGCHLRWNRL
jgi:hypothetical protein